MQNKAYEKLSTKDKQKLKDVLGKVNYLFYIPLLIITLAYLFNSVNNYINHDIAQRIFFSAMVIYNFGLSYINYNKMIKNNFNEEYMKAYYKISNIRSFGMLVLLFAYYKFQ